MVELVLTVGGELFSMLVYCWKFEFPHEINKFPQPQAKQQKCNCIDFLLVIFAPSVASSHPSIESS